MLRERVERQALVAVQSYAVYDASGRYEMNEAPSVEGAIEQFDQALNAEPEYVDPLEQELLELMGVR